MSRQLDITSPEPVGRVVTTALHSEMQRSYLEYAMSVIVGRALPDARDGLKPVHRRILYAMHELGLAHDRPYRKCARVVGDVLGKYHPHGDTAVYDALVRLVQDFSSRYPLIAGHGNFGSIDNDPPAAMRYTECRLAELGSTTLLAEVDDQTVDFNDNFDGSQREPVVLPTRLPVLLLNGSAGIAVGMATNIPPHNLGELVDGLIALIDNPQLDDEALLKLVPGPDFPTGGEIVGTQGIREAHLTGRGSVTMRGVCNFEEVGTGKRRKPAIVVTELPFQVNKAAWIEKVADLVNLGKLQGISDLRDESNREGVRVVFELKREVRPETVLASLYRQTALQTNFGVILLALADGQPRLFSVRQLLDQFLEFRIETLTRRTRFNLDRASDQAHRLSGQLIALENLPAIVQLLSTSQDVAQARVQLQARFALSERQAEEILQMPLRRLTMLDRERLGTEYRQLSERMLELQSLLDSRRKLLNLLKRELRDLKKKFADPRRTRILTEAPPLPSAEQLIADEAVVLEVTWRGYVRRRPPEAFVRQTRARRGQIHTEATDFVIDVHSARVRHNLLVITRGGRAYSLKVNDIPTTGPKARGTPVIGLLSIPGEQIAATFALADYPQDMFLVILTRDGRIKKIPLGEVANLTARGLMVAKLSEGDEVIQVGLAASDAQVVLATSGGRLLRFAVDEVQLPAMGRAAVGLKALQLRKGENLVGMAVTTLTETLLLVTRNGWAKRLKATEVRAQERGGVGTPAMKFHERGDVLIGMLTVG
ncbi:MAG: DNA gyrase subunit A, partial [Gemmatimonadaceae bacterium]|nr:DNA gyrase subunit A [Gloeobacterales cyanobacterium ES-bin-141]